MKYYIAYGSNLNLDQMAFRCPDARPIGKGMMVDRRLVFNGVATVVHEEGARVPVGIWEISESDERSLDRYEGYPRLYRKEYVHFRIKRKGKEPIRAKAIVYVMNEGRRLQSPPSEFYYQTIKQGYKDFRMSDEPLKEALENSIRISEEKNQ